MKTISISDVRFPFMYCHSINNLLNFTDTVAPNLGSMDPLVVHKRYQGIHRVRNFVLRLKGG